MTPKEQHEQLKALVHALRPKGVKLTAVAAEKKRDGKLLCCTRKDDPSKVCLPGGHVEPEDFGLGLVEALMDAAAREFTEEVGLPCAPVAVLFQSIDECDNFCTLVRVHAEEGVIRPEFGTECLWLTPEELVARSAFPKWYAAAYKAGVL